MTAVILIAGCSATPTQSPFIPIVINIDGGKLTVDVPPGSSVQNALDAAKIVMEPLDKVNPSAGTALADITLITVTRVREEFDTRDVTLPFEHQTVRNEALPEGQTMLIQPGENGQRQDTYRRVFEDNQQTAETLFKSQIIKEARPEIVMIGVRAPFSSVPIQGNIVYLTSGNVWMMEGATGNRRPIVTTADLDGHVLSLSSNGKWLLFTRKIKNSQPNIINSLWITRTDVKTEHLYDLHVSNVINAAGFIPGKDLTFTYSTVESRTTAPGWQSNNDLQLLRIDDSGQIIGGKEIVPVNSGGVFGWWGTRYVWSQDGERLAYARPDSIGLVNPDNGETTELMRITPLQTRGDWAWVPAVGWSPDHRSLFFTNHNQDPAVSTPEQSQRFNVSALVPREGLSVEAVPETGMFAYPVPSPWLDESNYLVAYLQAAFPAQSETSRTRLMVMDRDGSNRRQIFPVEGSQPIEPQQITWSPPRTDNIPQRLAVIYQGNIWFVDPFSGLSQQITGDGLVSMLAWR
ncbi:MAG TPA: G5 domain-containing protein [Leptolinea sp.]